MISVDLGWLCAALSLGILLGSGLGFWVARIMGRKSNSVTPEQWEQACRENAVLAERSQTLEAEKTESKQLLENERTQLRQQAEVEKTELKKQLSSEQARAIQSATELASHRERNAALQDQLKAQKDYLEEIRRQTRADFENLAHKIFDEKGRAMNEQSQSQLKNLLDPLKERLKGFEDKVEKNYGEEAKERNLLKSEVHRLFELNQRMSQEAANLTQALKGDSKIQGDWGEMILERILESAGLREGHEYKIQSHQLNREGERFRPDVILMLPGEKHLIVDSKVSLKAYEEYCSQPNPAERELKGLAHIKSITAHIDELADKHYSQLKGIHSPDFVFAFVPIEGAYLLAAQQDPELISRAWRKGVAIVTSTTLFTTLRTVASLWKLENQNRNAQSIAEEAGKLYDKFVGLAEDLEKIGKTFETGQAQFSGAMNKLREGNGNLFRRVELLRELGATPTKRIKTELIE